jgi:hypothetical protein
MTHVVQRFGPIVASVLVALVGCDAESAGSPSGAEGGADGTGGGGGSGSTTSAGGGGLGGDPGAGGVGGSGGGGGQSPMPSPTCDATAKTGDYCGGDKVSNADPSTLYRCNGPGPATVQEICALGCVVAPPGYDDYCELGLPECPHDPTILKYGLCPDASDRFRCVGIAATDISQTIGNAPASAGTHAQDGTIDGVDYCAATDLRTVGLTDADVYQLVDELASQGYAAFFRDPGKDGWPSSEARHIHAIYVGVPMKSALQAQVHDWLDGLNGLASHAPYAFYQADPAKKLLVEQLFAQFN